MGLELKREVCAQVHVLVEAMGVGGIKQEKWWAEDTKTQDRVPGDTFTNRRAYWVEVQRTLKKSGQRLEENQDKIAMEILERDNTMKKGEPLPYPRSELQLLKV